MGDLLYGLDTLWRLTVACVLQKGSMPVTMADEQKTPLKATRAYGHWRKILGCIDLGGDGLHCD
jgi:hypothetical protein